MACCETFGHLGFILMTLLSADFTDFSFSTTSRLKIWWTHNISVASGNTRLFLYNCQRLILVILNENTIFMSFLLHLVQTYFHTGWILNCVNKVLDCNCKHYVVLILEWKQHGTALQFCFSDCRLLRPDFNHASTKTLQSSQSLTEHVIFCFPLMPRCKVHPDLKRNMYCKFAVR